MMKKMPGKNVDPPLKDKYFKRIGEIENFIFEGKSKNVAIVNKFWFDQLIEWIKGNGNIPEKCIDNSRLYTSRDNIDINKKWKTDFEIVEMTIWKELKIDFTCENEIIRELTFDPNSLLCIILKPLDIVFETSAGVKEKTVSASWKVGDVKRILCVSINVVNSENELVEPANLTAIDDDMTFDDYESKYGRKIILRAKSKSVKNNHKEDETLSCVSNSLTDLKKSQTVTNKKKVRLNLKQVLTAAPSISPKRCGLINLGNTCYMNSALQSILHLKLLFQYVLSPRYSTEIIEDDKGIAKEFATLVKDFCTDSNQPKNPHNFRLSLVKIYSYFSEFVQHDAHEVLVAILDGIHEDVAKDPSLEEPFTPRTENIRKRYPGTKKSKIEELFGGVFYNSITCPRCKTICDVYDPFTIVSLPIKEGSFQEVDLEDCFKSFMDPEVLDDSNKWYCSQCDEPVCATKTIGIEKCGPILILHLKRFCYDGMKVNKIDTNIKYPTKLNLSNKSKEVPKGEYHLVSAIYHSGSSSAGHYTAACYDSNEDTWFLYNDDVVKQIPKDDVITKTAYILIYSNCL